MVGPLKRVQSAIWSLLVSAVVMTSLGTTAANATTLLSSLFRHICISVSDLAENLEFNPRHDLADRVRSIVQARVDAAERGRKVWTEPNCMKADQPGFDLQLPLKLSVKRQKVKLDGRDWNVVVAGGVTTNGLIPDGWMQPVLIIQQDNVSDDSIADALVEFVDRTVVAAVRKR